MTRSSPAPSEQTIYTLWDLIEQAREKSGEQAAQQLAMKALAAVEPPKQEKEKQP